MKSKTLLRLNAHTPHVGREAFVVMGTVGPCTNRSRHIGRSRRELLDNRYRVSYVQISQW